MIVTKNPAKSAGARQTENGEELIKPPQSNMLQQARPKQTDADADADAGAAAEMDADADDDAEMDDDTMLMLC